ncbi:uncharacterized protein DNG_09109 [Cephalotrichum gorgonifer]|uniref:Prion-inhibition and propagation HeLo domain-containing protein n=1 Tax=Cephalotrichum gorgonifer TaxID=2041049 RepID=A0AAE8SZ24_9PEZI|nr:uncharacterized protein DNG_09109 [Cephalotrichum gorgonifer]
MEPIGFTSAIASIPGVFKSCMDCFEYIQLARHFGDDFGFCLAQLEATQLQFTRWGKVMGLFDEPFDPDALYKRGGSAWTEPEIKKAIRWIGLLHDKFEAAKKTSDEYALEMEDEDPDVLLVPDQDQQLGNAQPPVRKLVFSMRKVTKARQKGTTLRKKVKWALYTKSHFEMLIENITRLVDKITELFPNLDEKQQGLAKEEVKEVEVESIPVLAKILATRKTDKLLDLAIKERVKAEGHVFRDIEISMNKDGFHRMGNTYENVEVVKSEPMTFERIKIGGSGVSHAGHIFTQTVTGQQSRQHEGRRDGGDS